MSRRALSLLALMLACGWAASSHAHGKERQYGTPINGRSSAPPTGESRGAPAFTLLALSANLSALERDLGEGRSSEVREKAQRLPGMTRDLIARSRHLGVREREQVDLAAQLIVESAERIGTAPGLEVASILLEVTLVRAQIAALEDLLRDAKE